MGSAGTFFAVLPFGILGLFIVSVLKVPEAGGIIFIIAIAAACIVDAVGKSGGPKA